jgi:hypothetical protein
MPSTITNEKRDLIEAVREYAVEHYDESGWDIIVETYDDNDLADMIGKRRTEKGALIAAKYRADLIGSVRSDIAGTAF